MDKGSISKAAFQLTLKDFEEAASRISKDVIQTPLLPLLDALVDDIIVVSNFEAEQAIRSLSTKSHLVSEGAGAVALAAAMSSQFCGKKIVAVISGGNIDVKTYSAILNQTYSI